MTIPSGWYFCAESSEIKPGKIVEKFIFNQKLILWRTLSGKLSLTTAVCPHLGSDLSKLGRVKGEALRCFSHDYTYNPEGDCIGTGQGTLPLCHKNVLKNYPLQEINGFILAWYDSKHLAPTWSIPKEVLAINSKQYVRSDFIFNVPIETINEDNFDVGHLYKWHNVHDVKTTPVTCDGPTISIAHAFNRHSIVFQKPLPAPFHWLTRAIHSQYSSTLHGHGLTNSFIDIFNLNIRLQDLIWPTPISETKTQYTTFLKLEKTCDYGLLKKLTRHLIFKACIWRLRQEHKHEGHGFWERQSRVANPILTSAELALIGPYREWCQQFITQ